MCLSFIKYIEATLSDGPRRGATGASPPPPPHFYRTRGYLCSFPSTRTPPPPPPYLGKRYTPISGICNHWLLHTQKHLLPRVFSGNLPETMPQNTPFSRENGKRMQVPFTFEWDRGAHPPFCYMFYRLCFSGFLKSSFVSEYFKVSLRQHESACKSVELPGPSSGPWTPRLGIFRAPSISKSWIRPWFLSWSH